MYIPALVEPSLPGLPMASLRKTARRAFPILTKALQTRHLTYSFSSKYSLKDDV